MISTGSCWNDVKQNTGAKSSGLSEEQSNRQSVKPGSSGKWPMLGKLTSENVQ